MTKAEVELLDKAALVAFGVDLKRQLEEPDTDTNEIAMNAWNAAYFFIDARYDYILEEYFPDIDTLREILELDGNIELLSQYKDKPEPLKAYSEDTIGTGKTTGQMAITRWLRKQTDRR